MPGKRTAPDPRSGARAIRVSPFLPLLFFVVPAMTLAQQAPCFIPPELRNPETTLTIHAMHQSLVGNILHLRGHVIMTYRAMRLAANQADYNRSTGDVNAAGGVVLDDPQGHLEAARAHYNIYTGKGWFSQVHGYLKYSAPAAGEAEPQTPLFMRAEEIERLDTDTYTIEDAHLSSCQKESNGLAFAVARAKFEVGGRVSAHRAIFRFLSIPVFFLPFFTMSAAREPRQTGFLLPHIADSTQKGFTIGDGFFWAINPSADLLLGLENFSFRGLAFSGRFRAQPSATSDLIANFFAINDRASGSLRDIRAPGGSFDVAGHADNLGDAFRGVVDVGYVSSLAFRETWADNFNTAVFSEARQTGFASKNWGPYSLNFYASRYQDFLSASPGPEPSVVILHTPSVSFSGLDNQIGLSPFYFNFDTSIDGVGRSEPDFATPALSERMNLDPQLTLRLPSLWHFHLTPEAGVDETFYGTSLKSGQGSINRLLGEFSVDLRPPSFEKIFARKFVGRRFKHVIEPDIQYHLVKATDPQNIFDIVRFDTEDVLTEDNELEYSLTNSILERKDAPRGQPTPQARDVLSWTISQKYFFDPTFGGAIAPGSQVAIAPTLSLTGFSFPEGRRLSPINSILDFSPTPKFDVAFRTDIAPQGGGVLNAGVTSRVQHHSLDLAVTDFFVNRTELLPAPIAPNIPITLVPAFNLLNAVASYTNPHFKRLTGAFRIDYNLSQGIAEDFVTQVTYNFGCFGLNAQYERFNLGFLRNENRVGLSITVGRIGTFGSLRPSQFIERQLQQLP